MLVNERENQMKKLLYQIFDINKNEKNVTL